MSPQEDMIERITAWSLKDPQILGALLVGSYARHEQTEDSDIDIVIIVDDIQPFLEQDTWIEAFGSIQSIDLEDYGLLQSRRVIYDNTTEVEFGITTSRWLATDPIDTGTKEVLAAGYRILDDKRGLVAEFNRSM